MPDFGHTLVLTHGRHGMSRWSLVSLKIKEPVDAQGWCTITVVIEGR